MRSVLRIVLFTLISFLIFFSCEDNSSLTAVVNNPPELTITLSKDFAEPSEEINVTILARDPDGDTVYINNIEVTAGELIDTTYYLDTNSTVETGVTVTQDWIVPAESGEYFIIVETNDSLIWVADSVSVFVQDNSSIPGTVKNIYPKPGTVSLATYVNLQWDCRGRAGSQILYDVYLGQDSTSLQKINFDTLTVKEFPVENLEYNSTYYWKVEARYPSETDASVSDIWSFNTRIVNNAADQPFEFVTVPAGDFVFGQTGELKNLDYDYEIMKYEVTNQQYKDYLDAVIASGDSLFIDEQKIYGFYDGDPNNSAGYYLFADFSDSVQVIINGDNVSITSDYDDHPVSNITWFGANAFALYYGLSLPTNDEWEKAATGNNASIYPFSDELDLTMANYADSVASSSSSSVDTVLSPWRGTAPVGSYNGSSINPNSFTTIQTKDSKSFFGCYDIVGNVWEWTLRQNSDARAVRGGSYFVSADYCESSVYYYYEAASSYPYIGFRCVRKQL